MDEENYYYGLAIFYDDDGNSYAISSNSSEIYQAVRLALTETIWELEPSFLIEYVDLASRVSDRARDALEKALAEITSESYEGINDDILEFIGEGYRYLIRDAISTYGAGRFLAKDSVEMIWSDLPDEVQSEIELEFPTIVTNHVTAYLIG